MFGSPLARRGMPGVLRFTHWASMAPDSSTRAAIVASAVRRAFILDPPRRLFRHKLSTLKAPGPAAHRKKKRKQNRIDASIPASAKLCQNPRGAHDRKYATAISPDRMKATGRVKRPRIKSGP